MHYHSYDIIGDNINDIIAARGGRGGQGKASEVQGGPHKVQGAESDARS